MCYFWGSTPRQQRRRERRDDVIENRIQSSSRRGEPPLIHRYHGFVAGGGSDCEENKDFRSTADGRSPFPEPDVGPVGLGLPFCPSGCSWHPGYTLFLFFFIAVNFHPSPVEDGRPGGVHHQSDVPFQALKQLRGDQRRQIHSQVSRGRYCCYRGELILCGSTCFSGPLARPLIRHF